MIPFDIDIYRKFSIILLFNICFFAFFAYILPIHFETNDDTIMCLIASGYFSGIPDAHLVFINYLYGFVLAFFYKNFHGIEWYTLFFCILHILSLTIIIFKYIRENKSIIIKCVSIILIYLFEIRLILFFQFTTTAALTAFAGLLLLFSKKRLFYISGILLFLIAVLIRFDAAMLVCLMTLPIFFYITLNNGGIKKHTVLLTICILSAITLKYVDYKIYSMNQSWADYIEYNTNRGQINDHPNENEIIENLPDNISKNACILFLNYFPDKQIMDKSTIKQLVSFAKSIPLKEKIKNIYFPFRKHYGSVTKDIEFVLIIILFCICFFTQKQIKNKLFCISYLVYFLGIVSYISLGGIFKGRVFYSLLIPILFYIYISYHVREQTNSIGRPLQVYKKMRGISYIGIILLFSLFLSIHIFHIKNNVNYPITSNEQLHVLENIKNKNVNLVIFAGDLLINEICKPFNTSKALGEYPLTISGWLTGIPFNKGTFDSYISLIDNDTYIFISTVNKEKYLSMIQEVLIDHYNVYTEIMYIHNSINYSIIKLKEV
jgi:hypothetical protein